jgi:hypothetical protein
MTAYSVVMPGFVPGIHVFLLHKGVDGMRNSGLPELRHQIKCRKSGKPDLR